MKLPSFKNTIDYLFKNKKYLITLFICLDIMAAMSFSFIYSYEKVSNNAMQAEKKYTKLSLLLDTKSTSVASLKTQIAAITNDYTTLQNTDANKKVSDLQSQIDNINSAFTTYSQLQDSINSAKGLGINVDSFNNALSNISSELLSQKFANALSDETTLNTNVNNAVNTLKQQQAAAAAAIATPAPAQNLPGSSFNTTTVSVNGQNVSVYYMSIDLTSPGLRIITDTADGSDCANNCTVTNLMDFYTRNNGFAAINGTYFCPATYSSCQGKINSYDFPVFNTSEHKWINQANLSWINRSMITFNGTNVHIYPDSSSAPTSGYTSAFVMAPGLVSNGQVIVGNYPLDTKSQSGITTRAGMGVKGNNLIIADAFGITVPQMAYVMQALGCSDAINVDGGGSTAMIYNGQYKLGPGRNIPNAIVFSRN